MDQYLISFILFLFITVAIVKLLTHFVERRELGSLPYERVDKLFSSAERSFLGVLEQLFGNEYRILGKVRLADIIRARKGISNSARANAFNRISGKHVDFAICDLRTLQVIGVIELDDSSHEQSSRRRGDDFKNKALAAAGVPIVRVPAQRAYSPAEVRAQVSVLFGQNQERRRRSEVRRQTS